jgi:5-methyltetrahydropteroyltriglutamate--homocysteine methyltransferase
MLIATKGLPLATTVTGSLPRPSWFNANLSGRIFSVAMADPEFREQYIDAMAALVSDQLRAGLDILTDGDARFDKDVAGRSWFAYVLDRMKGMEDHKLAAAPISSSRDRQPGDILYEAVEARLPPVVTGKVSRGDLEYARLWKVAQRMSPKPVKFGAVSGQLLSVLVQNKHYTDRHELVMDLSCEMNDEYHALVDAGCPIIQVEEPCIHEEIGIANDPDISPEFYVEAFNREVQGLRGKAEVWCHTCWGSPLAQRVQYKQHDYTASLPYLAQLDADVITFETADTKGIDFANIGAMIDKHKKVAIGVVSHRSLIVERPEEVAELIRHAMKYIEPERLVITSDCGFGRRGMSRIHAFYKMVSLVRGTNLVRRELGLPEAAIMAADPRFALLTPA